MSNVKTFAFNSIEEGKAQYEPFMATITEMLGEASYVNDASVVELAVPVPPADLPGNATAAARTAYVKAKERYDTSLLKLYKDFLRAQAVLRSILPYGTAARSLLDAALKIRPVAIPLADWNPRTQYANALAKLKAEYEPSSSTDTEAIKSQLMTLSDQCPNGFVEYRTKFNLLHNQLLATGIPDVVSETELKEWARRGIQNPIVFQFLTPYYIAYPNATYQEIFIHVDLYLGFCQRAKNDPYLTISGSGGKASVSVNNAFIERSGNGKSSGYHSFADVICTRCWTPGHGWKTCTRKVCGACNSALEEDSKTCSKWRNHPSPKHRFILNYEPWNKPMPSNAAKSSSRGNSHSKRPAPEPSSVRDQPPVKAQATDAVREARKTLKKAINLAKKSNDSTSG